MSSSVSPREAALTQERKTLMKSIDYLVPVSPRDKKEMGTVRAPLCKELYGQRQRCVS